MSEKEKKIDSHSSKLKFVPFLTLQSWSVLPWNKKRMKFEQLLDSIKYYHSCFGSYDILSDSWNKRELLSEKSEQKGKENRCNCFDGQLSPPINGATWQAPIDSEQRCRKLLDTPL